VEKVVSIRENIEQLRKNLGDNNFGDVMVVGGGISGIQASLDLATAASRYTWSRNHRALEVTWPSSIRHSRPTTVRCEYLHLSWSRSAGIPTSRSSPLPKLRALKDKQETLMLP